jgi:hypothetical protein
MRGRHRLLDSRMIGVIALLFVLAIDSPRRLEANFEMVMMAKCTVRHTSAICDQARHLLAGNKMNPHGALRIALYDHKWPDAMVALRHIPDRPTGLYSHLRQVLQELRTGPAEIDELAWQDSLLQSGHWLSLKGIFRLDTRVLGLDHLAQSERFLATAEREEATRHFRRAVSLGVGEEAKTLADNFCKYGDSVVKDISSKWLTVGGEPVVVRVERSLFEIGCGAVMVDKPDCRVYQAQEVNLAPDPGFVTTSYTGGDNPFGYLRFYSHQQVNAWSIQHADGSQNGSSLCIEGNAGFESILIPLEPTADILLMSASFSPEEGGSAFAGLIWRDAQGARIGNERYLLASVTNPWWQLSTRAFRRPDEAVSLQVVLLNPSESGRVCFDDVLLVPVPTDVDWDTTD